MGKQAFWVEFEDRKAATIEVDAGYPLVDDDYERASVAASAFGKVKRVHCLPYPREPRIGEKSDCPAFCYGKGECLGHTSCPQRYACSE